MYQDPSPSLLLLKGLRSVETDDICIYRAVRRLADIRWPGGSLFAREARQRQHSNARWLRQYRARHWVLDVPLIPGRTTKQRLDRAYRAV